ncbi:MAG TPA: alpha/beta hydrolase [Candidatus Hydrogenedentes bacterium]|nr:alpha/beta hydrolase [Candidatus Hydrogenedentota bacterium]
MSVAVSAGNYRTERGIVYADLGTRKLKMTTYIPTGESEVPRPGMVLIHGGAWILGTRYQQAWYCRNFARAGYVVMTIDYRLMPRYPFPACIHDCKAAVRWLRLHARQYNVDSDRIVTFGASAGGHLAALLATTTPEDGLEGEVNPGASTEVRAAISLYGAVDLQQYYDQPLIGPFGKITSDFFDRFTKGHSPTVHAASPLFYARPDTKPIMMVHGTTDHLVHYSQSERFYEKLKSLGVPVKLVTMEGHDHGFDYIWTGKRRRLFGEMLEFLAEHGCAPARD